MVDAPAWLVWTFDLLILVGIVVSSLLAKAWINVMQTRGKMVAEIWEPNGDTTRELVKPDPMGATITFDNIVYRLPKELSDKELRELNAEGVRVYPRKRWIFKANKPLPPIPLRVESWERDNPEPIRPFYGRIKPDGMFDHSLLTVTGTEWQAQKSVIQAAGIAMSVQEREARENEWVRAMANLPNKAIIYIGIGLAVLLAGATLVIVYQLAM